MTLMVVYVQCVIGRLFHLGSDMLEIIITILMKTNQLA